MKKYILFLIIGFSLLEGFVSAQTVATNYTFAASSGTYTANSSPTTCPNTVSGALGNSIDDRLSDAINIGFTFSYNCTNYTQFKASTNGWMTLNTAASTSQNGNDLDNSMGLFTTANYFPIIAPLWDDLATNSNGTVNYKLTGTTPNQVMTIEWKNMCWSYSAGGAVMSFQVKLFETTNVIQFVYKQNGTAATASASASIGITGVTAGDFISINSTPTASTSTETTTISTKPADNGIYTFTPSQCSGTPTAGSATASSSTICSATSINFAVTGASTGCGLTYQWQSSPNNSAWTNIGGATSATYSGTVSATTYYRRVITCSNGGATANSSSVLVTLSTSAPVCSALSSPADGATGICSGQILSWAASASTGCLAATGYDVYLQAGTNPPTTLVSSNQTGLTYTTTGLAASTTYYWMVLPKNANGTASGCTVRSFTTSSVSAAATTLPFTDNFSASCPSWNIVNGTQTNKWVIGSATGNTGNSMYISNDAGTSNAYTHSTSTVHFYKDITFPASPTCFELTFDWKGDGESSVYDYDNLKVFLVSTATTPVAGTAVASGSQIGATWYNLQTTWQTVSIIIPASNASTTQRLVFSWTNDGSGGNQPPAAVDNISITANSITVPNCATYTSPSNGAASICPKTMSLNWTAPSGACNAPTDYKVYFGTNNTPTNILNGVTVGNVLTYSLSNLTSSTTYYWRVVPTNSIGDATCATVYSFTTSAFTADNTAPINDDFSQSCADWTIVNGSEENQWVLGSATGNGGQSMYISNDGGTSNVYSESNYTSEVHFYKDIDFPAGLTCINLSFDWKCEGSFWDYLTVGFASPTTTITAGSYPTHTNWIGDYDANGSAWQTVSVTLPTTYAGTTQRLVFTWNNDDWDGITQPPAAIDNVIITATAPPLPSCPTTPSPAAAAVGICPIGTSLTWVDAVASCQNLTGYKLYFGTNTPPTNIINGTNIGVTNSYSLPTLLGSTVYYWRLEPVNATGANTSCTIYSFTTAATPSATACESALGTGVTSVASLPYTLASGTLTGSNVNSNGTPNIVSCGSTAYTAAEDNFYVFTPAISGSITITCSMAAQTGMFLYEGCPLLAGGCGLAVGTCIGSSVSTTSGTRTITICVTAGVKYYLLLDIKSGQPAGSLNFTSLSIPSPTGTIVNDDPCSAVSLSVGSSCSYSTYSNACASASAGVPAPGCASYSGGDVWFKVTVPASGTLTIDTQTGVMLDGGMAIYSGTCGALTLVDCNNDGSANGAMPLISGVYTPGSTLYIRVWEYGNNNNGTFGICVTDPCPSGTPSNDVCSGAQLIAIGGAGSGDNSCSYATGEPTTPSCWTGGTRNTVWFKFVPTSTSVKIHTILGSLTNTQMAVYSGACSSSMTLVACNDDASSCGGNTTYTSELTLTGLTIGATYYLVVDGANSLTGTFVVQIVDGSSTFPGSAAQDCIEPNPVCGQTTMVGNPGYQSFGTSCDLPTSYCLASGERNVVWYTFTTGAAGNIEFDIVPNDFGTTNPITGQSNPGYYGTGAETDYDFAIWKTGGGVTCTSIQSGASTPLRCNYDSYGVTGLYNTGNAPAAYSGFNSAYESMITAAGAGEVYMIAISNYASSTSGFTIQFSGAASGLPVSYVATPTTVVWSGGLNTAWNNNTNWGGCAQPTCTINAETSPVSTIQPIITSAMGVVTAKDVMINPGSTLTLQAGAILEVCGNFTNLGNLVCSATSTIRFIGTTAQTIDGLLTGANKLGNLTINKTGGSLTLMANLDAGGTFTTSNSTSIFNTGGYYIKLAGDFLNSSGTTTFTGINSTTSTLEFVGTGVQSYSPGGALILNNVNVNNTSTTTTGITIAGANNMILSTTGILTLNAGIITTGATLEVEVRNTATTSVTAGNVTSYVQGNLHRYLAAGATGSFEFPVGDVVTASSGKGYQRANLSFTSAAAASAIELTARFDQWGGAWTLPVASNASECAVTYDLPDLDNGYWTINASAASTGLYDITLYNLNYTNSTGASGWTVEKSPSSSPSWGLNGTCIASPVTAVRRTGLTGFSKFATRQASLPLPVELAMFTGNPKAKYNLIEWVTESEKNNDYFSLESSSDGVKYRPIAQIKAAGNSTSTLNYNYKDYEFFATTYYKLKQVDFDGKYTYSDVIVISNNTNGDFTLLDLRPNPAKDEVNVVVILPHSGMVKIELIDLQGRVLKVMNVEAKDGEQKIPIEIADLAQGVYLTKVSFEDRPVKAKRLIKY